jgi:hypothetical protein
LMSGEQMATIGSTSCVLNASMNCSLHDIVGLHSAAPQLYDRLG